MPELYLGRVYITGGIEEKLLDFSKRIREIFERLGLTNNFSMGDRGETFRLPNNNSQEYRGILVRYQEDIHGNPRAIISPLAETPDLAREILERLYIDLEHCP